MYGKELTISFTCKLKYKLNINTVTYTLENTVTQGQGNTTAN